jgi:hypothetical protein
MRSRTSHIVFCSAVLALAAAMLVASLLTAPGRMAFGLDESDHLSQSAGFDDVSEITMLLGDAALGSVPSQMPASRDDRGRVAQGETVPLSDAGAATQTAPSRYSRQQQELVQRWLEVANDIDPALGAKLTELSQQSPLKFDRAMRQGNIGRNLNSMALLKQRDPDLYQTKVSLMMQTVQVNRIAAQLREAIRTNSAGQIETLKAKLKTALEHQLGTEIKDKGDYICRIEEQLERARDDLIREAVNFPHTIESRLDAHMKPREAASAELDELAAPAATIDADKPGEIESRDP